MSANRTITGLLLAGGHTVGGGPAKKLMSVSKGFLYIALLHTGLHLVMPLLTQLSQDRDRCEKILPSK